MEERNSHRRELNDDTYSGILLLLSLPLVMSGISLPKLLIRIIDQFHLSLRLMDGPDTGLLTEGPGSFTQHFVCQSSVHFAFLKVAVNES